MFYIEIEKFSTTDSKLVGVQWKDRMKRRYYFIF